MRSLCNHVSRVVVRGLCVKEFIVDGFKKRVGFDNEWQYPFELELARNRIWIRAELNGDKAKSEICRMALVAKTKIQLAILMEK